MYGPVNFVPNDGKSKSPSSYSKRLSCKRNYRSSSADNKPLQKQAKYQTDPSHVNFDNKEDHCPVETDDFTEFYFKEPFSNRSIYKKDYAQNMTENRYRDNMCNDVKDGVHYNIGDTEVMKAYDNIDDAELMDPYDNIDDAELMDPYDNIDDAELMDPYDNIDDAELMDPYDNIDDAELMDPYDNIGDTELMDPYNDVDDAELMDPYNNADETELMDPYNNADDAELIDPHDNIGDTEVVKVNTNICVANIVEAFPRPRQSFDYVNMAGLSPLYEEIDGELNSSSLEEGEIRETENFVLFPEYEKRQSLKFMEMEQPKPGNFVTPQLGWKKVFEKYSPSTQVLHSPVKPLEANLKPNVSNDYQIHALVWVVSMSEQFYYDNSITLLYTYKTKPQQLNDVLIANSRRIDYDALLESMMEIVILGSGTFGEVYRVKQRDTGEYFAIKYLKKMDSKDIYEHTKVILNYLSEKNSLIKARNSPFVVQFLRSITFPSVEGLFLIFEWCLCDLRKYMLIMANVNSHVITNGLWNGLEDGIDEVHIYAYSFYDEDYFTVTLIYVFELFCAIDFLARCNIVHQDLKPENIMIGTNFHLKIADFGLVYNTNFITRNSQLYLVDASNINLVESSNYKAVWGGTQTYEDLELCYRHLLVKDKTTAQNVLTHPDRVNPLLSSKYVDHNPDFLSDLWACGIIATELLLGNVHFFSPPNLSSSLKKEMEVTDSYYQSVLAITYRSRNYQRYVKAGLKSFGGEENVELMNFLASIFKPRIKRAKKFVKEKEIYRYKNKIKLKHIDIDKVEQISVFESLGITSNNVFLYTMPEGLGKLLDQRYQVKFPTLRSLLFSKLSHDNQKFLKLEPGIKSQII